MEDGSERSLVNDIRRLIPGHRNLRRGARILILRDGPSMGTGCPKHWEYRVLASFLIVVRRRNRLVTPGLVTPDCVRQISMVQQGILASGAPVWIPVVRYGIESDEARKKCIPISRSNEERTHPDQRECFCPSLLTRPGNPWKHFGLLTPEIAIRCSLREKKLVDQRRPFW